MRESKIFLRYFWGAIPTLQNTRCLWMVGSVESPLNIVTMTNCWVACMIKGALYSKNKWSRKSKTWYRLFTRDTIIWLKLCDRAGKITVHAKNTSTAGRHYRQLWKIQRSNEYNQSFRNSRGNALCDTVSPTARLMGQLLVEVTSLVVVPSESKTKSPLHCAKSLRLNVLLCLLNVLVRAMVNQAAMVASGWRSLH